MKIVLISVGKAHDALFAQAIAEFTERTAHYFPVQWKLIAPPKQPSSGGTDQQKAAEAQLILAQLQPTDFVVLLDERGKSLTSPQLAEKLVGWQNQSVRTLVFVIAGAFGAGAAVQQRANFVWSLGQLIYPHMLVRLILAEQLYRAGTIIRNEKYHHV